MKGVHTKDKSGRSAYQPESLDPGKFLEQYSIGPFVSRGTKGRDSEVWNLNA